MQPTQAGDESGIGVGAFLAAGAASFGPLEAVTPADHVQAVAAGYDRDDNPLAVWSAPLYGSDPAIAGDHPRYVVRTATRTG